MHGTDRTLVNPSVSARDAFAVLDERKQLEVDEVLAAGGHVRSSQLADIGVSNTELELNARELERVAALHTSIAIDLRLIAARIRKEVVPTN